MSTLSRNKKILITGSGGQLGQALAEEANEFNAFECIFLTRAQLNITSPKSINAAIKTYTPDIIINTAAYTAVDAAEDYTEEAYHINETAVSNLAAACKKYSVCFIHISTDYVFDGNQKTPYQETDTPNPTTVYGASKLAGEQAILDAQLSEFAIIRTSWVYSKYGVNFVKTMLRLVQDRSELSVVNDQLGCPTYANDLANALFMIASQLDSTVNGVYHYSNKGNVSWYAFAKAIFSHTNKDIKIIPVTSEQYPTKARRPKNSLLATAKISETFKVAIPEWEDSLKKMLASL